MFRNAKVAALAAFIFTLIPQNVFAGSVFVSVSPSSIASFGSFTLTMSASGVTSCTWSRLDNGTVWAWKDQPVPGPDSTVYDSGTLSGWPGPATYEWMFDCYDGVGGTYSGSAFISISSGGTPPPPPLPPPSPSPVPPPPPSPPLPTSVIKVTPPSLDFWGVYVGDTRIAQYTITNIGPTGTYLSGSVTVSGEDFFCDSGCAYSGIPSGGTRYVVIRFSPSGASGPRFATVTFTGGGGATGYANGTALALSLSGSLDFGKVLLGQSKDLNLVVHNPTGVDFGSGILNVPSPFSCSGPCTYSLPPGATVVFPLTFNPTSRGSTMSVANLSSVGASAFTLSGIGRIRSFSFTER